MTTENISIHAPLTGRDPDRLGVGNSVKLFQSTRPLRGATRIIKSSCRCIKNFNPRAPYGARRSCQEPFCARTHFNPRAPYGARLQFRGNTRPRVLHFNPRAPYGARQQKCTNNLLHFCYNRQFKQKIHLYSIVCKNAIPLYLGICSPNWVRTYLVFFVRLLFAPKQLDHQRIFRHICLFTAEMLDLLFILLP